MCCIRFYQEGFKAETYTDKGMELIRGITMKEIILRHYPRLASFIDDQNVFTKKWAGGAEAILDTTKYIDDALEDAGRVYVKHYMKKGKKTPNPGSHASDGNPATEHGTA